VFVQHVSMARYERGWLLYILNLINTYMNECRCHQSHHCRIRLPANYHHQLQETWHISLLCITAGPDTDLASPGDIKLPNRSGLSKTLVYTVDFGSHSAKDVDK